MKRILYTAFTGFGSFRVNPSDHILRQVREHFGDGKLTLRRFERARLARSKREAQEADVTQAFAASRSFIAKCLILADTKCEARCSATLPTGESVTTAILRIARW